MENRYKVHQLIRLNGNPIFAGIYKDSELPDAVKENPLLCSKLDDSAPKTANYSAAIKTQNITVGVKQPAQGLESFAKSPAVNLDERPRVLKDTPSDIAEGRKGMREDERPPKERETPKATLVNLKNATLDNLSALDGITISTAQSVIEQRTKKKFVDFEDLDKRIPLKGGRKWSSFSDRLEV